MCNGLHEYAKVLHFNCQEVFFSHLESLICCDLGQNKIILADIINSGRNIRIYIKGYPFIQVSAGCIYSNFLGNIKLGGEESMSKNHKRKHRSAMSDEQAVRKNLSKEFDHEFANEPLTPEEKFNNKKTKKRQ